MKLVVISDREQYEAALASGEDLSGIKILCDNPAFHPFLNANKVSFEILDEKVIKDKWQSINIWAYEKSLLWTDLLEGRKYFNGIELNKALYIFFSYYLANFLKNYLLADYVYKRYAPQKIIVFDINDNAEIPFFNGNRFLNLFLKTMGITKGIEISSIKIDLRQGEDSVGVKEKVRGLLQNIYGMIFRTGRQKSVFLVSGSIRHLGSVMKSIKDSFENIVLYDHRFNFEQFRFCIKNGFYYLVSECMGKTEPLLEFEVRYKRDFEEAVSLMRQNRWFLYEGVDLSDYVCNEIISHSEGYIKKISQWSGIYNSMIGHFNIKGLLINEDWSSQGAFMAAFFKNSGIKVFCISHGYGAAEFNLPEESRRFYLSETFVNSGFEREYFSSRGWDRKHLHTTGIPRYDKIQLLEKKKNINKKMRILFCGGTLLEYSPGNPLHRYHMSILRYTRGKNMQDSLKSAMKAIEGYDIELIVIPRYNNDEHLWKKAIEDNDKIGNTRLIGSQADFLKNMSQCNAVLIAHWSTSILESVIFGKPIVVISYTGIEDPFHFEREGLCKVARSHEDLKKTIGELYRSFVNMESRKTAYNNNEKNVFYLGINDGNNTKRVADKILEMSGIRER